MTRLDIAQEALKEGGLRMTSTRHAILQLIKEEEKYFTIEQIAEEAGERKMDTVTVYRIMQAFEELGLVHKLLSVNGFVAVDPNDQLYYAFFIDQDTHTVGRKVVEKIYLS
jgi:Fe2+ or Zn2+ uptake regulation protein